MKNLSEVPSCPAPAPENPVEREDEILLARSPYFPLGIFSVHAGFLEPGESAEESPTQVTPETVVAAEAEQLVASGASIKTVQV